MNLDIPYDRLGLGDKVEYIPLKLAVNDLSSVKTNSSAGGNTKATNGIADSVERLVYDADRNTNATTLGMNMILMSILVVFIVLVVLFVLYYFFILRGRRRRSLARRPPLL